MIPIHRHRVEGPDGMNTGNCPKEFRPMETTYTACSLILLIFAEGNYQETQSIKAIFFYQVHLKKNKEYRGRRCEVLLPYSGLLKAVWGKRSQECITASEKWNICTLWKWQGLKTPLAQRSEVGEMIEDD